MAVCNKDSLLFHSSDTRCVVPFVAACTATGTSVVLMVLGTALSLKTMKL